MKGKAFILVGHENWGKSQSLKSLTDNNHHVRRIIINGKELLIRRMSNDDQPESLLRRVKKIDPQRRTHVILTLCPNFHNPSRYTVNILNELAEKYELFFWVLKFKYATNKAISEDEIKRLEQYGTVEVFGSGQAESKERVKGFKEFIEKKN